MNIRAIICTFFLVFCFTLGAITPQGIIEEVDKRMYPDAKTELSLTFINKRGEKQVYRMFAYAKDSNQKVIVRFTAPASSVGNDLIMLEKNVWMFDKRSGRTMKIPSNLSFGDTGFSYGDVVRLNIQDNYTPELVSEDGESWVLNLTATDRSAPYYRIELIVLKDGYILKRGTCYGKNNEIVKVMKYSNVKEFNGVKKPDTLTVESPLNPGETNIMVTLSEELKKYPDNIFNKRNLAARMEERF